MNEYEGLLKDWQVEIMKRQIKKYGIQKSDTDDAMQHIALVVADFAFDETKANGGSPEAVFCIFVNHAIMNFTVQKSRERKRDRAIKELKTDDRHDNDPSLRPDIATIRNRLIQKDRAVLDLLEKMNPSMIAKELGVTRRKVEVRLFRIRKAFKDAGF